MQPGEKITVSKEIFKKIMCNFATNMSQILFQYVKVVIKWLSIYKVYMLLHSLLKTTYHIIRIGRLVCIIQIKMPRMFLTCNRKLGKVRLT